MDDENLWQKRYEREKKSRKEAEKLLEEKSYELYHLNENLKKKIDDELIKSRKRERFLAEQSKLASMGEMIGNIAHQWRQPLSAITTSTSAAQIKKELGILDEDELDKLFLQIIQKANFLSETIDDFRNFFKVDKEKINFNILDIVENVKSIVHSMYQNNDIELIQSEVFLDINYYGFPNELSQVLLNLLNNARDVLLGKDIKDKKVKIEIEKISNKIIIKVFDNGGGVPLPIIDKIFEPYFTTKHQTQGTGIGLYMSREIIKNHFYGELHIENNYFTIENQRYFGACFKIELKSN